MSIPEAAPVGSVVGRIWAKDRDVGVNAEMKYSIIDGDGRDTFDISTDPTNRFGIITVKKVGRTQMNRVPGSSGFFRPFVLEHLILEQLIQSSDSNNRNVTAQSCSQIVSELSSFW